MFAVCLGTALSETKEKVYYNCTKETHVIHFIQSHFFYKESAYYVLFSIFIVNYKTATSHHFLDLANINDIKGQILSFLLLKQCIYGCYSTANFSQSLHC